MCNSNIFYKQISNQFINPDSFVNLNNNLIINNVDKFWLILHKLYQYLK